MLSCDCGYGDYDWYVEPDEDFSRLDTARSRKCPSCDKKITVGETCLYFRAYRASRSDYEERRFGDQVPMAPKYLCESCGEIWLNLNAAGFCLTMGHDLRDDLREYWEKTGFDPKQYAGAPE